MKNFHHFPKNTPTGYPDLKKAGPLGRTNLETKITLLPDVEMVIFNENKLEVEVDELKYLQMEVVTKLGLLESWSKEEEKFFLFSSKFKEYLELHSQEDWVKVEDGGRIIVEINPNKQTNIQGSLSSMVNMY